MTSTDPKEEVETLRGRIETAERGGSEADRNDSVDPFTSWISRGLENFGSEAVISGESSGFISSTPKPLASW